VELLLACGLCLLPERWRSRWAHDGLPFGLATHLTAFAQIIGAFFVFGFSLWRHFHTPIPSAVGDAIEAGADSAVAPGAFWFIVFWFTARGLFTLWLLGEGVVRFLHAFHDEPVATLPLALIAGVVALLRKTRPPPPKRADRVTLDGDLLTIASAEPYDWDATTTIRRGDRLWRVRETRWDPGVWPHVYVLEPAPTEHLLRRVVDYPL
jgi:hypothetical protein